MEQPKKYPGSDYQELFNHMQNEHGLILLESQMQDIIHIVNKMQVPDRESELIEMLEQVTLEFEEKQGYTSAITSASNHLIQSVKQPK